MIVLTIEEARRYLGMGSTDSEHDDLIEDLERRCLAQLSTLTGRKLGALQSVTEIVSGNGSDSLYVSNPVISITQVRYRFAPDFNDPWAFLTTDPSADIFIEDRRLSWNSATAWPSGINNIEITYQTGYTLSGLGADFPEDLKAPLLELIGSAFRGRAQATGKPGTKWRGLSDEGRATIAAYRRPGR